MDYPDSEKEEKKVRKEMHWHCARNDDEEGGGGGGGRRERNDLGNDGQIAEQEGNCPISRLLVFLTMAQDHMATTNNSLQLANYIHP
jgi:hypothetical protein